MWKACDGNSFTCLNETSTPRTHDPTPTSSIAHGSTFISQQQLVCELCRFNHSPCLQQWRRGLSPLNVSTLIAPSILTTRCTCLLVLMMDRVSTRKSQQLERMSGISYVYSESVAKTKKVHPLMYSLWRNICTNL